MFLIPYEIETLRDKHPWLNWAILLSCVGVSVWFLFGNTSQMAESAFVLNGFKLPNLFSHILLHANASHLIGNMLILWVFGNAICCNINSGIYALCLILFTLLSAATHLILDGAPAVGASGMINGIVGMTLAMYPRNYVHMGWFFFNHTGTFSVRAWVLIITWLVFDLWGVISGSGRIGYWSHIGGLAAGVSTGLLFLKYQWVQLSEFDNESLLDLIRKEDPSH